MTIKIGIVDDNNNYRRMLLHQLTYYNHIQVTLEANNGISFLNKLNDLNVELLPDIVLVDIDMPEMDGIITIANASIKFPQIKYLMLTVFDDDDKIFEAIKCGAGGYLLKDESVIVIIQHIEQVIENNAVPMSTKIARKTLELLSKASISNLNRINQDAEHQLLTERELEILKLMANGKDYKHIAQHLFLSTHTVRKHISNIYAKLRVNSKIEAIQMAQRKSWI